MESLAFRLAFRLTEFTVIPGLWNRAMGQLSTCKSQMASLHCVSYLTEDTAPWELCSLCRMELSRSRKQDQQPCISTAKLGRMFLFVFVLFFLNKSQNFTVRPISSPSFNCWAHSTGETPNIHKAFLPGGGGL